MKLKLLPLLLLTGLACPVVSVFAQPENTTAQTRLGAIQKAKELTGVEFLNYLENTNLTAIIDKDRGTNAQKGALIRRAQKSSFKKIKSIIETAEESLLCKIESKLETFKNNRWIKSTKAIIQAIEARRNEIAQAAAVTALEAQVQAEAAAEEVPAITADAAPVDAAPVNNETAAVTENVGMFRAFMNKLFGKGTDASVKDQVVEAYMAAPTEQKNELLKSATKALDSKNPADILPLQQQLEALMNPTAKVEASTANEEVSPAPASAEAVETQPTVVAEEAQQAPAPAPSRWNWKTILTLGIMRNSNA